MDRTNVGAPPKTSKVRLLLIFGFAFAILGLAAAGATTVLGIVSTLILGPILLASGAAQVITAFLAYNKKEMLLRLAAAGFDCLFGFAILVNPVAAPLELSVLIAIYLVVAGIVRSFQGLMATEKSSRWWLVSAIGALLLAACVWLRWPFPAGMWLAALCLSLDFILHGMTWIFLSVRSDVSDIPVSS